MQCACAQEIELHLSQAVYLNETTVRPLTIPQAKFENINKTYYYKNKRLLRRIRKQEQKIVKDFHILDSLYSFYVRQFGPLNFNQVGDLDMLWRMGQIKEILNDTTQAIFYYGLALKNHTRYAKRVQVHYDLLRANQFNEYVDLSYYYRIVSARLRVDTLQPPKGVHLYMGGNINTNNPEYAPSAHPNDRMLLFTSRRAPHVPVMSVDYKQNEDLYYVEREDNGGWGKAKCFPSNISSAFNEGSSSIYHNLSTGLTMLYFVRCNAPDGMGVCDLYSAEMEYDESTGRFEAHDVKNLGPEVNSISWDSHPCISADGDKLFFASNRKGGFGRTDLYLSKMLPDGGWSKAENLGPIVNTLDDEVSPFLHTKNNTLYFSSKGHIKGYGGFDIFKSRWYNGWEEPANVGPLVNTPRDEYYFTVSGPGDTLFYANDSLGNGNFDLYSYALPMGARPDATYLLNGYLIDSVTHRPLTGIVMALDLTNNVEVEPVYINKYGYFQFNLVNGGQYQLFILGEDAIRVDEDEMFNTDNEESDSTFNVLTYSIEKKKPIILESIRFGPNETDLTPEMEVELDYLADFLKEDAGRKIVVRAHTDGDGDPATNLRVSQERANNIRNYLLRKADVVDSAVVGIGQGHTRPVFPNDTEIHKLRNSRVEFELFPGAKEIEKYRRDRINEEYLEEVEEEEGDRAPEQNNGETFDEEIDELDEELY